MHYSVSTHVQRIKVNKLWSTNHGNLKVQLYRNNRIFRNTIFRPIGGAAPRNFYTRYKMSLIARAHVPIGDRGPPYNFYNEGQKLA